MVTKALGIVLGLGACGPKQLLSEPLHDDGSRTFRFDYDVVVGPIAEGQGPIDIFIPLATSDDTQEVLVREVEATIDGVEEVEPRYGNRFWHGHVDRANGQPIKIQVRTEVRRRPAGIGDGPTTLSELRPEHRELFLSPNEHVPISGELVENIVADIDWIDPTPLGKARAIYDYVIDNMEYKKTGTGWGNGDTYWACSEKYGNCTDFHALFISLARAQGLPARFEIGFPIPEDRSSGEIAGYHCWVRFYADGVGWFPIDASEAWKHPERRDLYFGTRLTDRIGFTVGRDLVLHEQQETGPLNYFIYPHVEVGGQAYDRVENHFSFTESGGGSG